MNQYSIYIALVLEYFSSSFSFSKRIAIILVLVFVLVMKIALNVTFVIYFAGLETLVIDPKPGWLLQMDVSE